MSLARLPANAQMKSGPMHKKKRRGVLIISGSRCILTTLGQGEEEREGVDLYTRAVPTSCCSEWDVRVSQGRLVLGSSKLACRVRTSRLVERLSPSLGDSSTGPRFVSRRKKKGEPLHPPTPLRGYATRMLLRHRAQCVVLCSWSGTESNWQFSENTLWPSLSLSLSLR